MKMRMTVLAMLMAVTPQMRATVNRALRPQDFEVVWAIDASAAREASASCRPDLVLLDLNQPVQSAWENLENLRAVHPGVPVVALVERGAMYEGNLADTRLALIEKPVGATELAGAVNDLLNVSTGSSTDAEKFRESL